VVVDGRVDGLDVAYQIYKRQPMRASRVLEAAVQAADTEVRLKL
jgi:hypothetical protein